MAPYIPIAEEDAIAGKGEYARTSGQRNYLVTNLIIDQWLGKPKYETIEEIAEAFFDHPEHNDALRGLMRGSPFSKEMWFRSSRRAYEEFYRRVAAKYEDQKKSTKGNADPYIKRGVLWPNEAMTRFGGKA